MSQGQKDIQCKLGQGGVGTWGNVEINWGPGVLLLKQESTHTYARTHTHTLAPSAFFPRQDESHVYVFTNAAHLQFSARDDINTENSSSIV